MNHEIDIEALRGRYGMSSPPFTQRGNANKLVKLVTVTKTGDHYEIGDEVDAIYRNYNTMTHLTFVVAVVGGNEIIVKGFARHPDDPSPKKNVGNIYYRFETTTMRWSRFPVAISAGAKIRNRVDKLGQLPLPPPEPTSTPPEEEEDAASQTSRALGTPPNDDDHLQSHTSFPSTNNYAGPAQARFLPVNGIRGQSHSSFSPQGPPSNSNGQYQPQFFSGQSGYGGQSQPPYFFQGQSPNFGGQSQPPSFSQGSLTNSGGQFQP